MGSTYVDAALRLPTGPIERVTPKQDSKQLTLIERVTTLEALAFTGIALVLLVVGLITGVEGVFLLSLLSLLTAVNFAVTARAATDGAIETAPTQLS